MNIIGLHHSISAYGYLIINTLYKILIVQEDFHLLKLKCMEYYLVKKKEEDLFIIKLIYELFLMLMKVVLIKNGKL